MHRFCYRKLYNFTLQQQTNARYFASWVRCGKLKCNLYKWKTLKGQGNNLCTYNIRHMNNTFDKNIWVFLSLQWWKPHLLKYFGNQLLEKIDAKESKHEYGSYIWLSLLIPLDMAVTCSRVEKIYFLNVWSSSSTNWGHKNHTKEPNKKLISSILVKNCLNRQAMIWRKY